MMTCSRGTERCTGKLSIHCAHSLTPGCTDVCLVYSSMCLRIEPPMKALNEPQAGVGVGREPRVIHQLKQGGERLVSGDT